MGTGGVLEGWVPDIPVWVLSLGSEAKEEQDGGIWQNRLLLGAEDIVG